MENETLTQENLPEEAVEESLAAEEIGAEGTPPPPQKTPEAEADLDEAEAEEGALNAYYESLASSDLAAIRAGAVGIRVPASLTELSDPARYGALREAGLSPLEAYLATEGTSLLSAARDGRTHLSPTVSRAAARTGGRMATGDLLSARELFPSLSDGEIESLWRRARGAR